MLTRRRFLQGSLLLPAAPAIVKAANIMPVVPLAPTLPSPDPYIVQFNVSGLVSGSRVYIADSITGEVYANTTVHDDSITVPVPVGTNLVFRQRYADSVLQFQPQEVVVLSTDAPGKDVNLVVPPLLFDRSY